MMLLPSYRSYRFHCFIFLFQVVGLVWGYIIQQFSETVYVLFAGFFLAACVSTVPSNIHTYYLDKIYLPET